MTAARPAPAQGAPGVTGLLLPVAVPPALIAAAVLGVVVGIAAGAVAGAIAAVVVALAAGAAVFAALGRRAAHGVADRLGGRPADPARDARLVNLVEGLCTTAGARLPELRVLDADGVNLAVAGTATTDTVLVVTSGMLGHLSRMELEGLLAAGVAALRRGAEIAPTVAGATGRGVLRSVVTDRDLVLDDAAVRLTRYPPGLRAALEACERFGTSVGGVEPGLAHLWLEDPGPGTSPPPYRQPLRERIDALSEL